MQAEAQILVEAHAQVGFALRLEESMQDAHLAAVVGAGADRKIGHATQLAVGRIAVAQRGEMRDGVGMTCVSAKPAAV